MKLLILDIDGTLTCTNQADTVCFVSAFNECFGAAEIDTDWSNYPHTTDAAIFRELFVRHVKCEPTGADEDRMCSVFVDHLRAAYRRSATSFLAVAGAASLLETLANHPDWRAVLATGAWRDAARFKLASAGLPTDLPLASANDGISRERIIQAAVAMACQRYEVGGFERSVSVGDGSWDVRTACALELPFVGVSAERSEELLLGLGASHVIPDFDDQEAIFRILDAAAVPVSPAGPAAPRECR